MIDNEKKEKKGGVFENNPPKRLSGVVPHLKSFGR